MYNRIFENKSYCIMCKEIHNFCCSCEKNNLIQINKNNTKIVLRCCKKCKLYQNNEWKNKYFLENTQKNINYPKYIKNVIITLFLIVNRNLEDKTKLKYLPKELWFKILKMLNSSDIGIRYNHHTFSFCVLCNTFHKYDEAFFKNIRENYNKKEENIIFAYYLLKKNYSSILDNFNINYESFKLLSLSKINLLLFLDNYINQENINKNEAIYSIYKKNLSSLIKLIDN